MKEKSRVERMISGLDLAIDVATKRQDLRYTRKEAEGKEALYELADPQICTGHLASLQEYEGLIQEVIDNYPFSECLNPLHRLLEVAHNIESDINRNISEQ